MGQTEQDICNDETLRVFEGRWYAIAAADLSTIQTNREQAELAVNSEWFRGMVAIQCERRWKHPNVRFNVSLEEFRHATIESICRKIEERGINCDPEKGNFSGYMVTVITNSSKDVLDSMLVGEREQTGFSSDSVGKQATRHCGEITPADLIYEIQHLKNPRQKTIMTLRATTDMTLKDIAEELRLSYETVRRANRDALSILRSRILQL